MAGTSVVFNHFGLIASRVGPACKKIVKTTAKDINDMAKINVPVDTGFLHESIYMVTADGSTYGQGKATVQFTKSGNVTKRTRKNVYKATRQELLPEVADGVDDYNALVGVGATYGIYVEMGTRHMVAEPYFYPAVDWARGYFMHALDFEGLLASGVTGSVGIEAV
jgi:hypothetical protein